MIYPIATTFIKLHKASSPEKELWVSLSHIIGFEPTGENLDKTMVYVQDGGLTAGYVIVVESVDELIARMYGEEEGLAEDPGPHLPEGAENDLMQSAPFGVDSYHDTDGERTE